MSESRYLTRPPIRSALSAPSRSRLLMVSMLHSQRSPSDGRERSLSLIAAIAGLFAFMPANLKKCALNPLIQNHPVWTAQLSKIHPFWRVRLSKIHLRRSKHFFKKSAIYLPRAAQLALLALERMADTRRLCNSLTHRIAARNRTGGMSSCLIASRRVSVLRRELLLLPIRVFVTNGVQEEG